VPHAHPLLVLAVAAALCGCATESRLTETPANSPVAASAGQTAPGALAAEDPSQAAGAGGLLGRARAEGELSLFLELADAAGLTQDLREARAVTLLAPNNAAFEALPAGTLERLRTDRAALRNVLSGHLLPDALRVEQLAARREVRTLSAARDRYAVATTGEQLAVGEAALVKSDLAAGTCVLHVVDRVLLPGPRSGPTGKTGNAASPRRPE